MLVSFLHYGSTLKRKATSSSETPVDFRQIIFYIAEDRTLLPKNICTAEIAIEVDYSAFIKKQEYYKQTFWQPITPYPVTPWHKFSFSNL
jgi:hypothetical protein